jgi:hypothetical protein
VFKRSGTPYTPANARPMDMIWSPFALAIPALHRRQRSMSCGHVSAVAAPRSTPDVVDLARTAPCFLHPVAAHDAACAYVHDALCASCTLCIVHHAQLPGAVSAAPQHPRTFHFVPRPGRAFGHRGRQHGAHCFRVAAVHRPFYAHRIEHPDAPEWPLTSGRVTDSPARIMAFLPIAARRSSAEARRRSADRSPSNVAVPGRTREPARRRRRTPSSAFR